MRKVRCIFSLQPVVYEVLPSSVEVFQLNRHPVYSSFTAPCQRGHPRGEWQRVRGGGGGFRRRLLQYFIGIAPLCHPRFLLQYGTSQALLVLYFFHCIVRGDDVSWQSRSIFYLPPPTCLPPGRSIIVHRDGSVVLADGSPRTRSSLISRVDQQVPATAHLTSATGHAWDRLPP